MTASAKKRPVPSDLGTGPVQIGKKGEPKYVLPTLPRTSGEE